MDMDSAAPPQRVLESFDRNAAASEGNSEYLQSVSSESSSFIMVQPKNRLEVPSRLWVTTVVVIVIVLQVASTTGLFIFLNMSMAQVKLHAKKLLPILLLLLLLLTVIYATVYSLSVSL